MNLKVRRRYILCLCNKCVFVYSHISEYGLDKYVPDNVADILSRTLISPTDTGHPFTSRREEKSE
jgi:hypothetical protein